MMSRLAFSTTLIALVGLSACAGAPRQTQLSYSDELARLSTDCAERGGVLTPAGGGATGRPQTDYVCRISGGASRID